MKNFKLYKHDIGSSKEDLEQCLEHLDSLGFHTRFNSIKREHNARKQIGINRECHVVIRKLKGGYRAYLHIDTVVEDAPHLVHRVVRDPVVTERWGRKYLETGKSYSV